MTRAVCHAVLSGVLMLTACEPRPASETNATDTMPNSTSAASAVQPTRSETFLDRNTLKGPWSSDGESFALAVEDSTILYEFDMKHHPYQLKGDTIIVDFQDPTLGVQKKLVLKLTPDTLVIQDVQYSATETLIRVRQ
jgi:hypothetical protein